MKTLTLILTALGSSRRLPRRRIRFPCRGPCNWRDCMPTPRRSSRPARRSTSACPARCRTSCRSAGWDTTWTIRPVMRCCSRFPNRRRSGSRFIRVRSSTSRKGLPADQSLTALTLECWVRPWRLNGWQSLIGQHNYPTACGYGLGIDGEGRVQFYLSDGGVYRPERALPGPVLAHRQWQHVVGTWDGTTKSLWIDGKLVAQEAFAGPVQAGTAPLWLGACGHDGPAVNILDGDLAMPVIYDRALSADEIAARYRDQGLTPATGDGVLACWPLAEERGDSVADCSGHGRHGRIVNSATWMIGGPSFDGSQVPRFGDYDPARDPQRGHGLRFASDDLYDCRWQVTHEYTIPKTAKPGLYVGRFRFTIDGQPRMYHATFVVKRDAELLPRPRSS